MEPTGITDRALDDQDVLTM